MTRVERERDSQTAVLVAGIAIILFGVWSAAVAVVGGWPEALIVTLLLGAVVCFAKPSGRETRILWLLFVMLAGASGVGLVVDVVVALIR